MDPMWICVIAAVAVIFVVCMSIMLYQDRRRQKQRHRASINDITRSSRVTSRDGFVPDLTLPTQSSWSLHTIAQTDDDRDTTHSDETSTNSASYGSSNTPAERSVPSDSPTATPSSPSPSTDSGASYISPPSTDPGGSSISASI